MTLPSLPNDFHKFLILIGIAIIGYTFYDYEKKLNEFRSEIKHGQRLNDSIDISLMRFEYKLEDAKSELPNNDIKKLKNHLGEIKNSQNEINILLKLSKKSKERTNSLDNSIVDLNKSYIPIWVFGAFVFMMGGVSWQIVEHRKELLSKLVLKEQEFDLRQKGAFSSFCQSCGKKFNSIIVKGSNLDGKLNDYYCVDCYDNGEFKETLTHEEFDDRCKAIIKKEKGLLIKLFLKIRFKKLERWNKNEYF